MSAENILGTCIYHKNCADGFAAAWVLQQYTTKIRKQISYLPAAYGDEPPYDLLIGEDVYILDFSYPKESIQKIANVAQSVVILDHHKTAEKNLAGQLPSNVTAIFDSARSGAMITWDYFFPEEEPPLLLKHIQDRDLWLFQLPGTREIMANVFSYPNDFAVWDNLMAQDPQDLINGGEAIERKHHKDIADFALAAVMHLKIAEYLVPVCNAPPMWASDMAHKLAIMSYAPFGATYYFTAEKVIFSLRSTNEKEDVSLIAELYGGGGHRNAAGFEITHEAFFHMLEVTDLHIQLTPEEELTSPYKGKESEDV